MEKPIIEKAIRGTLKFLVFNRFYGFITRFDTREDIFVHGSEIRYINPMQFTRRCGDSVIFDLAVGVKGLEAVNVILNLAEQAEEDLCDDSSSDKDSIYQFDKSRMSKPALMIMKKKPPGLDDSNGVLSSSFKRPADLSSPKTFPPMSRYPSISSLSSISYDDSLLYLSVLSGEDDRFQKYQTFPGLDIQRPDIQTQDDLIDDASDSDAIDTDETASDITDVDETDDAMIDDLVDDTSDEYDTEETSSDRANEPHESSEVAKKQITNVGTAELKKDFSPIIDRSNQNYDKKDRLIDEFVENTKLIVDVNNQSYDKKDAPLDECDRQNTVADELEEKSTKTKTKMTLSELKGKSFRKMHEENMKRRSQALP